MPKKMLWIKYVISDDCSMPFIIPSRMKGSNYILGYDLEKFLLMKKAINSVKFSCFDKGGKCYNVPPEARCCCSSCGIEGGHFESSDLIFEKDIPLYNGLYRGKTHGFWMEGKGCTLPREHRSLTCISYNCERDKNVGIMVQATKNEARNFTSKIRLGTAVYLSRHVIAGKIKRRGYKLLPED